MKRVTVTLPEEVVAEIDRWEANRSKFVLEASLNELEARRRAQLERSLRSPHPDSERVAKEGIEDWGSGSLEGDEDLLDGSVGMDVRWRPSEGWREVPE